MLEIQKFARQFEKIEDANVMLREKLALQISKQTLNFQHPIKENVWVYNYSSKSPRTHPITMESRGLILNNCAEVVSMSFPRFFEIEEKESSNVEYGTAIAKHMLDGDLVVLYHYKNEWFVQTKHRAMADGILLPNNKRTIADVVFGHIKRKLTEYNKYSLWEAFDENYSYAFELTSPFNKHTIQYNKIRLTFLASFYKRDQKEKDSGYTEKKLDGGCGIRSAKLLDILWKSDDLTKLIKSMTVFDRGIVVVNADGSRIKIKNKKWRSLPKNEDLENSTEVEIKPANYFIDLVVNGKADETLTWYPNYREMFLLVHNSLRRIEAILHGVYQKLICSTRFDSGNIEDYIKEYIERDQWTSVYPFTKKVLEDLASEKIKSIADGIKAASSEDILDYLRKSDPIKLKTALKLCNKE